MYFFTHKEIKRKYQYFYYLSVILTLLLILSLKKYCWVIAPFCSDHWIIFLIQFPQLLKDWQIYLLFFVDSNAVFSRGSEMKIKTCCPSIHQTGNNLQVPVARKKLIWYFFKGNGRNVLRICDLVWFRKVLSHVIDMGWNNKKGWGEGRGRFEKITVGEGWRT